MRWSRWILVAAVSLLVAPLASGNLVELARAGDWETLLRVARRRMDQLPLRPEQALVAAHAARQTGDVPAEMWFLERAALDGDLRQVAAVQLAARVVEEDPERAVQMLRPVLVPGVPAGVRRHAADVLALAARGGLTGASRVQLERLAQSQPWSLRRPLQLALAAGEPGDARRRLRRLLERSVRDLPALEAARRLVAVTDGRLTSQERWLVAQALYRHAFYGQALILLGDLRQRPERAVPSHEVLFIEGRCLFRLERWDEAALRYEEAAARAPGRRRAAELQRHGSRSLELAGRLDAAVEAALAAVRADAADDHRLHLARLRLRQGRLDKAEAGIGRIRARSARERGQLMLALAEVQRDRGDAAARRLGGIRTRTWRGPAAVLRARLAREGGDPEAALEILDDAAGALDPYWAAQARRLLATLPPETTASWRGRAARRVASASEHSVDRMLGRWGVLENDADRLRAIRARVAAHPLLEGGPEAAAWEGTLAGRLWSVGLEGLAVAWDPEGMPTSTPRETWWSAQRFARLGVPSRAIRTADLAWRQVGVQIPSRLMPSDLRRQLHPLPWERQVRSAAATAGVPWSLLAAVAREESRWDPAVVSVVGARGLTQLMPATAAATAARLGAPAPGLDDLHRPEVGLELGAAELGRLLRAFAGRRAAAVAAYNAGEPQARLWLAQCGPGCSEAEYLLSVSFTSTRGYTTDVLIAAEVYDELYGGRQPAGREGSDADQDAPSAAVTGIGSPPGGSRPAAASARSLR